MEKTKIRDTFTLINGFNLNDCEAMLKENQEAIDRMKQESRNPAFQKPQYKPSKLFNNQIYNSYYDGSSLRRGGAQLADSYATNASVSKQNIENSSVLNNQSVINELQRNNKRIQEISQNMIDSNRQIGQNKNSFSQLNKSYISSLQSPNSRVYRSIYEKPDVSYRRIFIKCNGIEYEEYQDEMNLANSYKAIRTSETGQWKDINYTPEIIKPILQLKNRIDRSVEYERSKVNSSSIQNSLARNGVHHYLEKPPAYVTSSYVLHRSK